MRIAVQDLLEALIAISERSAQISRLCRTKQDDGLFDLLIQEKTSETKNPRFIHDFKTFADVLIQEVAKYYLEIKFPALSSRVYGEETNHFENKLGEAITVQIVPEVARTREMLVRILDGNVATAEALVQIIYCQEKEQQQQKKCIHLAAAALAVEQDDIAIWIDPIDSTSEYINGQWQCAEDTAPRIAPHGLHCVTCLFGVFDRRTGLPLLGVLNQPFYKHHSQPNGPSFSGRCLWGYSIDGVCQNNLHLHELSNAEAKSIKSPPPSSLILVGSKEGDEIRDKLNGISQTMYVAGAGYKILCVISGEADLLVTSSKTTFFWDTCAGHAILRSLGGGIIALDDILQLDRSRQYDLESLQLRYRSKEMSSSSCASYNHSRGLVAYRSAELIERTIQVLQG